MLNDMSTWRTIKRDFSKKYRYLLNIDNDGAVRSMIVDDYYFYTCRNGS